MSLESLVYSPKSPREAWSAQAKGPIDPSGLNCSDWHVTDVNMRVVARKNGLLSERLRNNFGYRPIAILSFSHLFDAGWFGLTKSLTGACARGGVALWRPAIAEKSLTLNMTCGV